LARSNILRQFLARQTFGGKALDRRNTASVAGALRVGLVLNYVSFVRKRRTALPRWSKRVAGLFTADAADLLEL
jgi:hypothetical protein